MLEWLFRRSSSGQRPTAPVRKLGARYDAAQTTEDNRRHWSAADALSPNSANSAAIRATLRNRARYEVANNSYARGIVLTLANDLIGTGPRLQMTTADARVNESVEMAWRAWSQSVQLARRLRTMRMARAQDGEAFALLATNQRLDSPVKLDLRLIEADQVTTPHLTAATLSAVDGIEFDRDGNPQVYHLLRQHPGDGMQVGGLAYDRIPADQVIHWYRADRPGQARGIPDITPALPLFGQLRRFTLAVLAAAETAADFAGILYTDSPAGGDADPAEPFESIEIEKRTMMTVPGGWKLAQLKAEQPVSTYVEFKHEILNEIARCLNMPYNVAAGNSASYNYASGRLDHQTYFKSIAVEQSELESMILDRIFAAWLDEAIRIEGFLPEAIRQIDADLSHHWMWDGHEHVDPSKEATAQATRLANHTTTLAWEYARQGRDWEAEIRQRAKEAELMASLGLRPAAPIGATAPATDDDEEDRADGVTKQADA